MSKTSRLLLLHVLLLALAREIEHPRSSDARRVLAPLRPVGIMQGRVLRLVFELLETFLVWGYMPS